MRLRPDQIPTSLRELFGIEVPKAPKPRRDTTDWEAVFAMHCRAHKLPEPVREHLFAKEIGRGWRFDFCWPAYHVAVECEGLVAVRIRDGSVMAGGRHATFTGYRGDCEKYATAAILGWYVLRFEQELIRSAAAIDYTIQLLKSRGWKP